MGVHEFVFSWQGGLVLSTIPVTIGLIWIWGSCASGKKYLKEQEQEQEQETEQDPEQAAEASA
jgi:hypothetical protein